MLLRRMGRLAGLLVAPMVLLPGCSDGSDTKKAASPSSTADRKALDDRLARLTGAGVFVGGVAFTSNLVAVHFDRRDEANPGMKIFLTDGLPGGNAEWFEGKATGNQFKFTAASGKATIEGRIEQFDTDGTVTLADGVTRNFFTRPAGDGAGAFEVTVGTDGTWTGKSLDGSTLTARQQGNYVEGAVVTTQGNRYDFRHNDLSRRLGYSVQGGAPDTYLTIVTRQATEIQGRGGDVRGGKPSANLIALDLHQTAEPTPGVYHGRVAFDTDRLNFELAAPNPDGIRRLRPTSPTRSQSPRATSNGSSRTSRARSSQSRRRTATPR